VIGLSSKMTKLCSLLVSPSYPKQVWDYLKQGLLFTVEVGFGVWKYKTHMWKAIITYAYEEKKTHLLNPYLTAQSLWSEI